MNEPVRSSQRLPLRFNELALLVAIVVVVVITAAVDSNHSYLNQPFTSFRDIARNVALLGIFALGAAVVIIAGGIDLSAGSMIAFSGTICASTMMLLAPETMINMRPVGPLVAGCGVAAAIASGFLIGTLHAWLITSVRLPPFVATLATLVGLRSFARAFCGYITAKTLGGSGNTEINVYDPYFQFVRDHVWIYAAVFLLLAGFTWLLLSRTVLGRHIYALGGNEQAARLSGIRTESVKWFAYCFSAVTASIAGVFYVADQSVASPVNQGVGYELNAIAAAVVGGCSLQGGVGTLPGIILGVVFLRVVIDSVAKLIKSGSDIYEGMIVGIVVVIAVTFSQLRQIRTSGRELFPGLLGILAIPTLAGLSGLITAMTIANVPYLKGSDVWIGVGVAAVLLALLASVKLSSDRSAMTTAGPIISIRSITKRFPGVTALADVTLVVRAGELHAICGENGAGKSTLMKILSGVITDFEGELLLAGKPVRFKGTRDAEAAGISIIHQELNLVEQLSAAANIFLGREIRGWLGVRDDRAMEQAAAHLLKELECDINPQQTAGSLRVGDQQLIEIAKALSLQSDILIMDEPTSALTEAEVSRLYRVVERLRKRGVTILYISHKMDEVFHLADRITVLRDGRLVKTLDRAATTPQEVMHLMVGREIEAIEFGHQRQAGEVLLKVENLSLPWPGHARGWRLKGVSFELRRGEVLGIAGLMGAGRTELLECLFGAAAEPPQGRIELLGRPVMFRHPREACAAGIGLVTEDRKRLGLFAAMNVGENVSICTLRKAGVGGFINRTREWQMAAATTQKLAVKMSGLAAPVTSLSGGNQQKCIIGRWLQTQPQVLLLDDPTRGVDVGAKAELYRLIDGLVRQGIGVIMTSSELPELLTVSDRILVLSEGRLTASFARGQASEQKIMEAATLGSRKSA